MSTPEKKRRAHRFGLLAERIAIGWLRMKGYQILAHRYKVKLGEVDLIALKKETLTFVEVKARRHRLDAIHALTFAQRKRIENAARTFLAKNPEFQGYGMRFDLVVITPLSFPKHLIDAWQPVES